MKSVLVFVFALCVVAYAHPRPEEKESTEEDSSPEREGETQLFYVPLQRSTPRRPPFGFGLSDDLVPPPLDQHPFFRSGPWGPAAADGADPQVDDFMTQMQQMLTEMRRQLTEMLHRSNPALPDNSSVGTRIGGDEDLPQNKTTSSTKVIDGHVVTVNETTFSSGDDNIGAVFRIKVVEVHPSETPETEGEMETEKKPEEPLNPNSEREPTTSKSELEEDDHEETNEIPNQKVCYEVSPELEPSLNEIEDFSVQEFRPVKKERYYDLSGDTKVNDYLAEQSEHQQLVMMEPEAEFVDTEFRSVYPQKPERLERFRYL